MIRTALAIAAVLATLASYQAREDVVALYVEPLAILERVASR